MEHWKRELIPNGFRWTHYETGTDVRVQRQDNRWTATLSVILASGAAEKANFFAEDSYSASLEKCLLYAWRAMGTTDKSTFDLEEALADLRRFAL